MVHPTGYDSATLLLDGRMLAAGLQAGSQSGLPKTIVEIYMPWLSPDPGSASLQTHRRHLWVAIRSAETLCLGAVGPRGALYCFCEIKHVGSIFRTLLGMCKDHDTIAVDDEVSAELTPILSPMQVGDTPTDNRTGVEGHDLGGPIRPKQRRPA